MTLIGKHILDLEDIKHILYDSDLESFLIVMKDNHYIINLKFTPEEYNQLLAELGVEVEFPHTDIVYDESEHRFTTECPTDGS